MEKHSAYSKHYRKPTLPPTNSSEGFTETGALTIIAIAGMFVVYVWARIKLFDDPALRRRKKKKK